MSHVLDKKETIVALVANGIAVYSMLRERDEIPDLNATTMYGFVLDSIPAKFKQNVTADLIDAVFESVTAAHNS